MVETMVSDSRFQSQLASIMETLAKTAILEIGKLVEESHAVFRSEISRRRSENESLKNKCDLLESELRASRSAQQRAQTLESARPAAKEICHRPTIDGVFGKEWCMDLWKENGPAASQKNQSHVDPCMMESIDLIDDGPEMIIIKDETYEDCPGKSKTQADPVSTEKGPAVSSAESSVAPKPDEDFLTYTVPLDSTQEKLAGPAVSSAESSVAPKTDEDFLTYTIPLDSTQERPADEQTFEPRTIGDAATSSYVSAEEFGGFCPTNTHMNPQKGIVAGSEQKNLNCGFCGKSFIYLSYLKMHLRTHSGEKPFACTVCGKHFAQNCYLKLHMRTHSGERPYTCMLCAKRFSQKSSLNIHLRRHTGEKPYSCAGCGKRYTTKHGLNIHQCSS